MSYNITLKKVESSRLPEVDFDTIPFGKTFSDHMFVADYKDGAWTNLEIIPFGPISLSPVNLALHYGQSIFEGMKATLSKDGKPLFFRPEMHAKRINASAARMCMPDIPEDLFLEALHQLVDLDQNWIPPSEGSALYIRPLMFATDEMLGVKVSSTYKFMIMTGPVGPYYPKPVKLLVESHYVRAAKGGVGEAKTAGNYAASLLPARKANEQGYDQVMWMDSAEFKYVQEVGTMNIFFVIDGKVITPATDGAILKGITRNTILQILKAKGIPVEERLLSIDEIAAAYKEGKLDEVFGSGTAAVIANVSEIKYGDLVMEMKPIETHRIAHMIKKEITDLRSGVLEDTYNWIVPVAAKTVTA